MRFAFASPLSDLHVLSLFFDDFFFLSL